LQIHNFNKTIDEMNKNYRNILLAIIAFATIFASSCREEEYDIENLKGDGINIHTSLAAPLFKNHSTFAEFFDMESIKGYLRPVDGKPIDLARTNLDELRQLLDKPLALYNTTQFNSYVLSTDIKYDEIFGEGNCVTSLDSLVLIFDVETDVPFDINLQVDFLMGDYPNIYSPRIINLHRDIVVPACGTGTDKVSVTKYIRYGDVCDEMSAASAMLLNLYFTIPEGTEDAYISINQYVDIKMKAFVEGDINPSEF